MKVEAGQIWTDEEVIKEELTFTKAELAGITTESLEEDV